jgi:hypothetical protein
MPQWKNLGREGRLLIAVLATDAVLLLILAALLLPRPASTTAAPRFNGQVVDAFSGEPVAGAVVAVGDQEATTDKAGAFSLPAPSWPATIVVRSSESHAGVEQELAGDEGELQLALRPTVVVGAVTNRANGAPLAGISVRAVGQGGEQTNQAVTGADGRYSLVGVPAGARLIVEGPGLSRQEVEVGERTTVDFALRPDVLAGTVRTPDGVPLAGATVAVGTAIATTGADGAYTLNGVPEAGTLVIKAKGYQPVSRPLDGAPRVDIALAPLVVRAIYLTPDSIINDAKFNALLALADRTEINAMVLDFKDESGWLHHDSKVTAAREIGAVHPAYDLPARLRTLQEHNIYTIARVVCFLDQTLPVERPHLAVRNTATGGIWENDNGAHWVSAMHPEAWDYNIAVAVEAASLGFDEVQYDYVRFPTDGDREVMDLGAPNTKDRRTDAIAGFLERTRAALTPYDTALAVDVFGVTLFDKNDNDALGQLLEKIAPHVDYICPMIYPSHYIPGIFGFDLPNDHPYEIILGSLELGIGRVPNAQAVLRPWLQDFSYGAGIDYGPNEVRAQIKATYDFGGTSWMLWNAANEFTEAALEPEGR